ncbi:Nucleoside [Ecytonucleospora hepatopenaei]|uniref:Nucleoside diphosphate kinase n=1 Tax=Ecytonucleospora hepatopenaei TaxID=646526 RepID=A0A1W0E8H1_9MICR|nr:Nucleoside [Ecytonucleospora hepatopenaei]
MGFFEQILKPLMEQTFIMVKPEGVKRRLVGEIISRFERTGLYLVDLKITKANISILEKHYAHLVEKPFFKSIVSAMTSGCVVPMIFEGENAVKIGRKLLGDTNPVSAAMGTIRGDLAINVGKNLVHGSDSVENAKKEIALWFEESNKNADVFDKDLFYE